MLRDQGYHEDPLPAGQRFGSKYWTEINVGCQNGMGGKSTYEVFGGKTSHAKPERIVNWIGHVYSPAFDGGRSP